MNNIFAVGFSDLEIQIAQGEGETEHFISLAFPHTSEMLLGGEKLHELASLIRDQQTWLDLRESQMRVSLPQNMAIIKRMAMPFDLDKSEETQLIRGDLEEYLPNPLPAYKIIRLEEEFHRESYKEIGLVAIQKETISNVQKLAELTGTSLGRLELVKDSLARYLKKYNPSFAENRYTVIKIGSFRIMFLVFAKGIFQSCYLKQITDSSEGLILSLIKDTVNDIGNLLTQQEDSPESSTQEVVVYGAGLTPSLFSLLQDNFSGKIKTVDDSEPQFGPDARHPFAEVLGLLF